MLTGRLRVYWQAACMHTRRQRVCRLVGLWVGGGRSSGWIWLSRPSYFFGFSLFSRVARRLHGPLLEFSQSWVPGHRVQGQSWVPGRSLVVVVVVFVHLEPSTRELPGVRPRQASSHGENMKWLRTFQLQAKQGSGQVRLPKRELQDSKPNRA